MALTTAVLRAEAWEDVERLFGPRGACAGCWCMFWRLERGERFAELKGDPLKRKFRAGILAGKGRGVSRALLAAAVAEMRRLGVRIVEGYPVKPSASGEPTPDAFAYTGTRPLFEGAGFRVEPSS